MSLHGNRSSLDDVNMWKITVLCGGWKAYSKKMLYLFEDLRDSFS